MVLNNYWAMEFVRDRKDQPLSTEMLLDLHRTISLDTLDSADQVGRFRTDADNVRVISDDDTVVHVPPRATELPERVALLCDFANGSGKGFIHPVVRAVLLHFWLGYDHPFCDGNGRTARALFYWSMLRQGYWVTEYVSISRVLKQAPAKYARSFLYSETPPFDATYFVLHQLDVIKRSILDLHAYLDRKMSEVRSVEAVLRDHDEFNHRQVALLSHGLRSPGGIYTMATHKRSHRISHETARQDLYGLEKAGLLVSRKRGREYEFVAVPDLGDVLRRQRGERRLRVPTHS
jgi:Fic family protein